MCLTTTHLGVLRPRPGVRPEVEDVVAGHERVAGARVELDDAPHLHAADVVQDDDALV